MDYNQKTEYPSESSERQDLMIGFTIKAISDAYTNIQGDKAFAIDFATYTLPRILEPAFKNNLFSTERFYNYISNWLLSNPELVDVLLSGFPPTQKEDWQIEIAKIIYFDLNKRVGSSYFEGKVHNFEDLSAYYFDRLIKDICTEDRIHSVLLDGLRDGYLQKNNSGYAKIVGNWMRNYPNIFSNFLYNMLDNEMSQYHYRYILEFVYYNFRYFQYLGNDLQIRLQILMQKTNSYTDIPGEEISNILRIIKEWNDYRKGSFPEFSSQVIKLSRMDFRKVAHYVTGEDVIEIVNDVRAWDDGEATLVSAFYHFGEKFPLVAYMNNGSKIRMEGKFYKWSPSDRLTLRSDDIKNIDFDNIVGISIGPGL